jgi:serine/threonine-protein kinase HipA
MTLLGHSDGDDHHAGASYLEIVEFLTREGAQPAADLVELWRRIVFSIAIRNTDDHLRNQGFLLTDHGWRLSPAYDLNPTPEVAPHFRLKPRAAETLLEEIRNTVRTWRAHANQLAIPRHESETMGPGFWAMMSDKS